MSSLTELAGEISAQATKLDESLLSQGRQHTSFDHDTLFDLPPEINIARENLINSTQTLKRLALRPEGVIEEILWGVGFNRSSDIDPRPLARFVAFSKNYV